MTTQVYVDGSRAKPDTPDHIGRRSKLTPQVETTILEAIELGVSLTAAAAYAGITERTLMQWLERGRAELTRVEARLTATQRREQGLPTASREAPFAQLVQKIERSRGLNETRVVSHLMEAIQGGWVKSRSRGTGKDAEVTEHLAGPNGKLALDYLERVLSKRYGRRQLIEVSGPDGGAVPVDLSAGQRLASRLGAFLSDLRDGRVTYPAGDPRVLEGETAPAAIETGAEPHGGSDQPERGGGVIVRRPDAGEAPEGR